MYRKTATSTQERISIKSIQYYLLNCIDRFEFIEIKNFFCLFYRTIRCIIIAGWDSQFDHL